ncbi:porin [Roseitalea porphyridii]|uniref:Porin n=1 Tax=Roseitalea porphyridii TaxID=1852022 RepID=A0A4P6V1F8_9HYPH|nr:porin [Roseitalea porphyridii]QBK30220.1 porin [Roseitalea porphyridii]
MKIRSLLLGSAAAMTAVTTANAADVFIPEPEVVEYVRVCDAAGEGYFYIPGSETCLKIGGYVRYQIDVETRYAGGVAVAGAFPPGVAVFQNGAARTGWTKNTRGQLTFETWTDSDLGALTSYIALQGNSNPGVTRTVALDAAWLDLAGLRMGVNDNAFDGGIVGESDSLGGAKVNFISYTFTNGPFSATLSLDDDNAADSIVAPGLPDFVPHVSANAMYDFGLGEAALFAAYDNLTDEWAVKGRVGVDVGEAGRLEVAAYYTSGATYVLSGTSTFGVKEGIVAPPLAASAYATGVPLWSEWSVQAGYQHQVTDALALTGNVGYWDNLGHADNFIVGPNNNYDIWNVGAVLDYEITEGFDVKLAITHWMPLADAGTVLESKTTGFARFQRSF